MRRVLITLALCGALGGCAAVSQPSAAAQVAIADAGTGIDATYNAAAQSYLAVDTQLAPATKATVKADLVKAYAYVQAADAAVKVGDATTLSAQIAAATSLITQATALLPAK